MTLATTSPPAAAPAAAPIGRRLGRFALLQLLGKSSRSMLWLARGQGGAEATELYLMLPRQQPPSAAALDAWLRDARHASRLLHPQLVPAEVGVEERWPYLACRRGAGVTLEEHLAATDAPAAAQAAQWLCDLLQGLAFAHEAGVAHGDVSAGSVLIDAQGRAVLMGLGAGFGAALPVAALDAAALGTGDLQQQRAAGEQDLLACGLLLHRLLAGAPPLDETDAPTAVQRLEREIVRLGWSTPQPVPDAMRAICNRATEREPRSRYLGARSLQRALQGWLDAQAAGGDGALALLLDRLHSVGHLPALPGLLSRVSAVIAMEQQRLDELTELIIQDPALAFELLRQVNGAQFAANSDGGVATVRRAVQLIGVQGLKRTAAGLRPWPGPLQPAPADALALALRDARMAAHVARSLCPADMDGEAAYLLALLQHLGPLLLGYHFADEADQIARLVHPEPPARGMTEAAAACAVIGVDGETLAVAVARHWGLDDTLLTAMRRVSTEAPVRTPDDRQDVMRLLASAAVEAVAAVSARAGRAADAPMRVARVAQRYARALVLGTGELADAVARAERAVDAMPAPAHGLH